MRWGRQPLPVRDEELLHQVVIRGSDNSITVSCNCRMRTGEHSKAGKPYYDPMAVVADNNDVKMVYNDPDNHWAPFEDKWRLTW